MNKTKIGYIIIITMLVVASFFSINLFFKQKSSHDILDIHTFPYKLGEWEGKDIKIEERDYEILETRNLIFREYINPSNEKIWAFIIYSETNRSVFHPPEVCMIGSGLKILDKKSEEMSFDKYKFLTNKLYIGDDTGKELVLYCYKVGNFYTENYYLQQALFAINQLLGRRAGGATVRISAPLGSNEEATLVELKDFMKRVVEELEYGFPLSRA
ncbi:MAG: exosortase C-terminal domain/associated protein EpsI [Candidatus Omnitrophota bacterium]